MIIIDGKISKDLYWYKPIDVKMVPTVVDMPKGYCAFKRILGNTVGIAFEEKLNEKDCQEYSLTFIGKNKYKIFRA